MEVVLLVVAVIGIALLVVPRLKRNRKPRARRSMPSVKAARRRAAVAAAAAPAPAAVSTWTPTNGSAPSTSDEDAWDDDLGWEGVDNPEPQTREAWQRWRETESPLAAAPEPVEPSTSLPSVERWRAVASSDDGDWLDDDDGLGWEGEESRSAPRVWVPEQPVTTTATAADVATHVETDFKSDGRAWATNGNGQVIAAPAPAAAPRRRRIHPVLLVALYAAVGIGVIVLASTALLGGSSSAPPQPASNQTPKAAPTSEPELTGSLADETSDGEFKVTVEPDTAATAAARKARRDFQRERSRALAAEQKAVAKKAAAARKAAADRRAQQQQQQSTGGTGGSTTPPSGGGTTPRQGGGTGGGGSRGTTTCEFCIG